MSITFNNTTAQQAITILRENSEYIDENIVAMTEGALNTRIREMEEAIRVLRFFTGAK